MHNSIKENTPLLAQHLASLDKCLQCCSATTTAVNILNGYNPKTFPFPCPWEGIPSLTSRALHLQIPVPATSPFPECHTHASYILQPPGLPFFTWCFRCTTLLSASEVCYFLILSSITERDQSVFIHTQIERPLGCFYLFGNYNKVTVSSHLQVSCEHKFLFDHVHL